jgi:ketosteroid isomerase-like protein
MIDAVALLKQYHAALNALDLDEVAGMFEVDALYVSPGLNGEIVGRDAIMIAIQKYFAEFRDQISADEEILLVSKNVVHAIWNLRTTSSITGKTLQRRGKEIVCFNAEGQIEKIEVRDFI